MGDFLFLHFFLQKINNWEWDQNFDQLDISMEIKCPNKFIQVKGVSLFHFDHVYM